MRTWLGSFTTGNMMFIHIFNSQASQHRHHASANSSATNSKVSLQTTTKPLSSFQPSKILSLLVVNTSSNLHNQQPPPLIIQNGKESFYKLNHRSISVFPLQTPLCHFV